MNKLSVLALVVALVALGSTFLTSQNQTEHKKESTFARVLRTGTIRCGYPVWPPDMIVDPNTKKISGYSHDMTEAVGKKLGLKIEWTEEIGWGTGEIGLATRRYDMVCADICLDAQRTKAAWFSTPYSFAPNDIFVRSDDHRFDDDPEKLNDPSVKFAVLPNTILDYDVRERFPKAGRVDVNDINGNVDLIQAVVSKKADASINLMSSLDAFNASNPNTPVKVVGEPLRYCHGGYQLPMGDVAFKHMIDSAIHEIVMDGGLRRIMLQYEPDDRRYWRLPAKPYAD